MRRASASSGRALAEGLAAIHECGLIHRDLKPSNVILADDGPRIIDFGIAKGADATVLTGSSVVVGTLRYMSPEQLQGQELTPQADVFALGTVLAYAAIGRDPFEAPAMPAVITRILTGPPDLDPLSGDLRDIIAACLAKDPAARPTPADLLVRFTRPAPHDPTVVAAPTPAPAAVPVPVPEPVSAWDPEAAVPAPDPVPAATPVPVPEPVPAAEPGPTPEAVPSPEPQPAEANGPAPAAAQEPSLADTVNVSPIFLPDRTDPPAAPAQQPTAPAGRSAALVSVSPRPAAPAEAPLRSVGLPARRRPRRRMGLIAAGTAATILAAIGIVTLVNRPAPRSSAAGTPPAASSAASPPPASTLTAVGKLTATLTDPVVGLSSVESVAFAPDGMLATGDQNGSTYLWNTVTGKLTATLTDPSKGPQVNSVAFGTDGILATGDDNGNTYLWNTVTGKLIATLTDPTDPATGVYGVLSVAFGPGDILATGDRDGSAYLWNTATGKLTATLADPTRPYVDSVAFGPGDTLATADIVGRTYLWNAATGKLTATLTDPADQGVGSVAFGSDGILAAGVGYNGNGSSKDIDNTNLWDIASGKLIATLTDPTSGPYGVQSVAFGSDGILATGDDNGNTYLWNTTTGKVIATLTDPGNVNPGAVGNGGAVAFGPGGILATSGPNGHTYLWHITDGSGR